MHTELPWELSNHGENIMHGQDHVAMVNMSLAGHLANARLIAAAPELLDMLGRLVHMAECNTVPGPNTLAQARALLSSLEAR